MTDITNEELAELESRAKGKCPHCDGGTAKCGCCPCDYCFGGSAANDVFEGSEVLRLITALRKERNRSDELEGIAGEAGRLSAEVDEQTERIAALEQEVAKLDETRIIARRCARKLAASYARGEISPRAEYEWLIDHFDAWVKR